MIPRRWPVTNTHPLREINPRDRRCFRGIISFGSGSWLTRTMVHFGRRLSAFRFSLFLSSFTPSSILRLIFFAKIRNSLGSCAWFVAGRWNRSENEFILGLVNGRYTVFFFFFFFFFDKTGGIADSFNWRENGLRVLYVEVRELRRQIFSSNSDFLITI